uniref:Uncharacterized protein n=1 Tax=Oryza brachyantha TaxID=4533 RepID=J3N0U6_ORYBR
MCQDLLSYSEGHDIYNVKWSSTYHQLFITTPVLLLLLLLISQNLNFNLKFRAEFRGFFIVIYFSVPSSFRSLITCI